MRMREIEKNQIKQAQASSTLARQPVMAPNKTMNDQTMVTRQAMQQSRTSTLKSPL